jgi:hypothetical protein
VDVDDVDHSHPDCWRNYDFRLGFCGRQRIAEKLFPRNSDVVRRPVLDGYTFGFARKLAGANAEDAVAVSQGMTSQIDLSDGAPDLNQGIQLNHEWTPINTDLAAVCAHSVDGSKGCLPRSSASVGTFNSPLDPPKRVC